MKFSLNWLNRYTPLPIGDKEKMNEVINRIALQIVDVDERWYTEKDGNAVDAIIDVDNKIITNRPYCFGHRGLAREISVMMNQQYTGADYPSLPQGNNSLQVKIDIHDPELCPRFTAIAIKGVKIGQSPDFLKYAVESVGLRSINNLVDITNLIMLDTAQPVHAYDYNKIKNGHIVVRRADEGEKVTTLDGVERTFNNSILLITDEEKPVGVAGVMGAGNSEIDENTTDVLLEIASFNPINIRQTAKFLKHRTDAVTRFEKGVDPTNIPNVMAYMVDLILQNCGGEIASDFIDVNNLQQSTLRTEPLRMEFDPQRVDKLLGFNIQIDFIKQVFDGFSIGYEEKSDTDWTLTIPTYRPDVKEPADLVEDIGRMYGYQNIPVSIPVNQLIVPARNKKVEIKKKIRNALLSSGLDEVITFSFISQNDIDKFGYNKIIKIVNPLSEEYIYLRPSLIPSLTKVTSLNAKSFDKFGIFEIARKFLPRDIEKLAYELDHGESMQPDEIEVVSATYYDKAEKNNSIFELKGALENLFYELKISDYKIMSDGKIYINDKGIGVIGLLNKEQLNNYELNYAVSYFEIELQPLLDNYNDKKKYKPFSRYQGSSISYSLFVPKELTHASVVENITSVASQFDYIYGWETTSGDGFEIKDMPENMKPFFIEIKLQKSETNISDEDKYSVGLAIEESIKNKLPNAIIRGGGIQKKMSATNPGTTIEEKSKPVIAVKILSIEKHANADRLVVTQVSDGKENYQIVTGAPNIEVGQIVPAALPGTVVPGLKDDKGNLVVMKVSKLRGIDSYGMLLAGDELGINSDHDGIFILDKDKFQPGDTVNPEELSR